MTVTVLPEVMQDMAESAYRQQVYIVAETQMHVAPWLFDEEGWDKSRLKAAIELVCTGKVTQTADGWHVEGSSREGYDLPGDTLACPCKAAAHNRKTSVCKHRVAVELARRVQQAYPQDTPLPFGPVTADERLAAAPTLEERQRNYTQASLAPTAADEDPQFLAPTTPQEDRMADDEYIPEPDIDDAPVAILAPPERKEERKEGSQGMTTPATSSLDTRALLESMASWKEQRQILARYIQEQLKDGVDYYTLRIKGRETKPTLSKAGSEKFLAIFKMTATFQQDQATWTMLGSKEGVLCYTCTLLTREGQVVGEGRGARTLAQDQGDINKAVKMAQKSAQIDAILRTGCLSDVFTQDIGEPEEAPPAKPNPLHPSAELRQRIWTQVQRMDATVRSREQVEAFIKARTGMDLHPDYYQAILNRLEGKA